MSGFGDAMAAAMKRRLAKQPAPTADDRQRQAEEAQRRLGYGTETPPKVKAEGGE